MKDAHGAMNNLSNIYERMKHRTEKNGSSDEKNAAPKKNAMQKEYAPKGGAHAKWECLRAHRKRDIERIARWLERNGRFSQEKDLIQHGTTSVYEHSEKVARVSRHIAGLLPVKVRKNALTRGALLHDYFLYDWHDKNNGRKLHGFTHPRTALENAKRDYKLTKVEQDIIAHHMFPLIPIPPHTKEGWIVCIGTRSARPRRPLHHI